MGKWTCEVIRDFDGSYCANMAIDGEIIDGLPEYVDYNTLKLAISTKTGIEILKFKDMLFEKLQRKSYAFIDNTQPRSDCRVPLAERLNGYKPRFDC